MLIGCAPRQIAVRDNQLLVYALLSLKWSEGTPYKIVALLKGDNLSLDIALYLAESDDAGYQLFISSGGIVKQSEYGGNWSLYSSSAFSGIKPGVVPAV